MSLSCFCNGHQKVQVSHRAQINADWCTNETDTMYHRNKVIKNFFIGFNTEPMGYEEDGERYTLYENFKMFGSTRYCVSRVEYDGVLRCYVYTELEGIGTDRLCVYTTDSCKECIIAAEKIIYLKESKK